MELVIEDEITNQEQYRPIAEAFHVVFKTACKDLKIEGLPYRVIVQFSKPLVHNQMGGTYRKIVMYKGMCTLYIHLNPFVKRIESILETFIHEMVHVSQMIKGHLKRGSSNTSLWNGVVYERPKSFEEYENLPWERDARTKADSLIPKVSAAFRAEAERRYEQKESRAA